MIAAVPGNEARTLRREDAAKYLGVSVRMLDRYVADGLLQRLKIGARSVYLPNQLDAFLSDREASAAVPGLLSRQQAAEFLSVSTRMIDKLVSTGRLPKLKNGLRTAFRQADLEAFIAASIEPRSTERPDISHKRRPKPCKR